MTYTSGIYVTLLFSPGGQRRVSINMDMHLAFPLSLQLSLCVHMKPYRRAARIPLLSYWAEDDDNEILISKIYHVFP